MRPSRAASEVLSVLSVRVLSIGRFLRWVLSVLSGRFLGVLRSAADQIGRRLCPSRKAAVVCLLSSSLRLFSHLPGTIHCLFFRQMRQMGTDKTDKTTMSYKHGSYSRRSGCTCKASEGRPPREPGLAVTWRTQPCSSRTSIATATSSGVVSWLHWLQ